MSPLERKKEIAKAGAVGIGANVALAGFKAAVGILSHSLAITMDAVNNLTDSISSLVTMIGVKLAGQEPDDEHPFGHGRIEYFSAIIVAGIILAAGIMAFTESVKKLFHPVMPDYSAASIVVVVVAIFVKVFLSIFNLRQGEKYNSDSLKASGVDARNDVIISISTLVCAIVAICFNVNIDGYVGLLISLVIVKGGIDMALDPVNSVIGVRPDSGVTLALREAINSIDGVMGTYDIILHNYGPDYALGSVNIEVSADMSADELHHLTMRIQNEVMDEFRIFLTVGIYAIDSIHGAERKQITDITLSHPGAIEAHGIHIDDDDKYMSYDVVTDFTVKNKEELRLNLLEEIDKVLPGYKKVIHFDTNYSG